MRPLLLILAQAVALTWTPSPTPNTTTTVYRDGTPIASGLTAAAYTDAAVAPGSSYTYFLTATAGAAVSAPSNTYTASIPIQKALTSTSISISTSPTNINMTKVIVAVKPSTGKAVPSGSVIWSINGKTIYTDTLTRQGQTSEQLPILLLEFVPVNITYQGNSTFAASTIVLP